MNQEQIPTVDLLVMPYPSAPHQLAIIVRDRTTHEHLGNITKPVPIYENHPNEILVNPCSAAFLHTHPDLFTPTGVILPLPRKEHVELWQITPFFRKHFLQPMDKTHE